LRSPLLYEHFFLQKPDILCLMHFLFQPMKGRGIPVGNF
jgi:hypothetical protein